MRVLIVDDEPVNLAVLAKYIELCGHEPVIADNGFAALGIAAQSPPDLILMDIMMPGMDGYETTRRLRCELRQTAPVYAVSALDKDPALLNAAGMTGHYRKPLALADLRGLLGC
jgi:CheY-like chemotaxis protein